MVEILICSARSSVKILLCSASKCARASFRYLAWSIDVEVRASFHAAVKHLSSRNSHVLVACSFLVETDFDISEDWDAGSRGYVSCSSPSSSASSSFINRSMRVWALFVCIRTHTTTKESNNRVSPGVTSYTRSEFDEMRPRQKPRASRPSFLRC